MAKSVNAFYLNPKWIRKSDTVKRRDEYRCKECSRYGITTSAQQVHHINPLDSYPYLAYESDNLISLCTACHNKMHDRYTSELTALGLSWVRRIEGKIKNKYKQYTRPGLDL